MSTFTLINELVDFTNELIELLKKDWKKFKIFVKEYKKYVFWIIVLLITMQFTDLMSLGTSWERYCNKNDIKNGIKNNSTIQKGGSNAMPDKIPDAHTPDTESNEQNKKKDKKEKKKEKKEDIKKKARQLLTNQSGSESKDIDKKLGMFKKFKGNLGNGAGPVFGNLDRIFKYTEAMFVILTSILIIVGVLSLPVLIFIVITYCVIKMMVGKFMIL